jgi:hypothetical protein
MLIIMRACHLATDKISNLVIEDKEDLVVHAWVQMHV